MPLGLEGLNPHSLPDAAPCPRLLQKASYLRVDVIGVAARPKLHANAGQWAVPDARGFFGKVGNKLVRNP